VLITNAPRIDSRHIAAARPYQVGVVLNKDLSIVKTPVALVTRGLRGVGMVLIISPVWLSKGVSLGGFSFTVKETD
jgi:hypothetical protein